MEIKKNLCLDQHCLVTNKLDKLTWLHLCAYPTVPLILHSLHMGMFDTFKQKFNKVNVHLHAVIGTTPSQANATSV